MQQNDTDPRLGEHAMIEKLFPVMEIFGAVIQGEGIMAGHQTMFVRFGGCDYRCSWCDSLHAVIPEQVKAGSTLMSATDILKRLKELAPHCFTVTISGGNPAIHNLSQVVLTLKAAGYYIALETQGTKSPDWLTFCNLVTISPKPPSSGMTTDIGQLHTTLARVSEGTGTVCMKMVVFNENDYEYALHIHELFQYAPCIASWFLQPGTDVNETVDQAMFRVYRNTILGRTQWLWEKVCQDPRAQAFNVLPQIHSLVFGHKLGV